MQSPAAAGGGDVDGEDIVVEGVPIETSSTAVERDTEGPIDAGEVMTASEEAVVREISGFSGDVVS